MLVLVFTVEGPPSISMVKREDIGEIRNRYHSGSTRPSLSELMYEVNASLWGDGTCSSEIPSFPKKKKFMAIGVTG